MPNLTAVLYHDVSANQTAFERGLDVTTSPAAFEAQINYLQKNYDIVDLDTVLSGRLPRRPLLITFDDFYASVLDVAKSVLAPRGLPSVFFVNADLLGHDQIALDNTLAYCVNTHGVAAVCKVLGIPSEPFPNVAELIANEVCRWSSAERAGVRSRLQRHFGLVGNGLARSPVLEPGDLARFAGLGIEVGNHTATHVFGRSLRPEELHAEIVGSKKRLETLCGQRVRSFSLPYGYEGDLTPELLEVLRASQHEAIFLVHGRTNHAQVAPDVWYRVSLHNERPSDLPMRLTVMPMLRTLKQRIAR